MTASRCILNVVIETSAADLRDWLALGAAIAEMQREGWRFVEGTERPDGTFLFRLQRAWSVSPPPVLRFARPGQAQETDEGEAT